MMCDLPEGQPKDHDDIIGITGSYIERVGINNLKGKYHDFAKLLEQNHMYSELDSFLEACSDQGWNNDRPICKHEGSCPYLSVDGTKTCELLDEAMISYRPPIAPKE